MWRIEVDIFSGRPNPAWIVPDFGNLAHSLSAASKAGSMVAKPAAGHTGLGYREVRVSRVGGDEPYRKGAPPREFAVGSSAAEDVAGSAELARQLIEGMTGHANIQLVEHAVTPLTTRMRDFLAGPALAPPLPPPPPPPPSSKPPTTVTDLHCKRCSYELSRYSPGFWNSTWVVQAHNNCYNYALNCRTDTRAQPGRASGHEVTEADLGDCVKVTTAALADGIKRRCRCLTGPKPGDPPPEEQFTPLETPLEYPRHLIALCVWRSSNEYLDPSDYHWYRAHKGAFWGHKPGYGTARNYDDDNAVITNPETCNRGKYSGFCGYFYAGSSAAIN
jgi:hypothetical protein